MANVSVIAARLGARVALAGGAADDDWGRWLRDRLRRERIDLSLFELAPEAQTPIELVTVGPDGESALRAVRRLGRYRARGARRANGRGGPELGGAVLRLGHAGRG